MEWEYLRVYVDEGGDAHFLGDTGKQYKEHDLKTASKVADILGKDSWELVSVTSITGKKHTSSGAPISVTIGREMWFKRPVEEE